MTNTFKKSFLILAACVVASGLFADTAVFEGSDLNVTGGAKTIGSITLSVPSSNGMTWQNNSLYAGGSGKFFHLDATGGASISQVLITMSGTSNRYTASNITNCTSCTRSGSVYTCEFSTPQSSIDFKNNGGGVGITKLEVTYSSSGGGGQTTPTVSSVTVTPATATLNPNSTQQLTATVSVTPSTADQSVTWESSNKNVATVNASGVVTAVAQGTATITATSNLDNTKSGTCAVTVNAPATPIPVTAIALNKTSTTIAIGGNETLTVNYTPSDANTGLAITWTSSNEGVATVDNSGKVTGVSAGTATITATSEGGKTATCTVTIQAVAVTGVTVAPTTASVQVNSTTTLTETVLPANATNKSVNWSSSNASVATVNNGVVTGISTGTATITVTTVDGNKTATCTVTVTEASPVPHTTLTLHTPGIYEDAMGYGKELYTFGNHEYEVYYAGRYDNGGTKLTLHVDPIDKSHGVTKNETGTSYEAQDGWFKGSGADKGTGFAALDEFTKASDRCHNMKSANNVELHIKGFNQFSLYGVDKKINPSKPSDHKVFKVLIDDVEQTMTPSTSATIRRFDISTGEHVIKIQCGDDCLFGGFSLRLAQEPSVRWIRGNDSTQVVKATQTLPAPIQYKTKYNNLSGASTELQWIGTQATGIQFTKISAASGALIDTFAINGVANCPAGIYNYAIVSKFNGVETSRVNGKFQVINEIRPSSDDTVLVYKDEEMDAITYRYYASDPSAVHLTWLSGTPVGITNSGNNGKYSIGGTPTQVGIYPFKITIESCDTVFYGQIEVKEAVYGDNAVLYLYKNKFAYNKDGVYNHLKDNNYNLIERMAKADGPRAADQYSKYKWILISEDADANNLEVISLIRDGAGLPILNMNGFTYAKDNQRLGWGNPNNGAIDSSKVKSQGCFITIERSDHPIFSKLSSKSDGKKVKILEDYVRNGIMPIEINNMPDNISSSLCLATAPTRGMDYYSEGAQQTAIHEIPAAQHGGSKYICFPVARQTTFTAEGKKLLNGIVEYLLSPNQASVTAPELRITSFSIEGINAQINETDKTITMELTDNQFAQLNSLKEAKPVITLANPAYSHVTPASGEEVNLQYSYFISKAYEVSDYINRVVYDFTLKLNNTQGIEEVYEVGQWVNIFDIYGRKVVTTNEDIYTMDLPRGMYIVVTESGQSLKIMR